MFNFSRWLRQTFRHSARPSRLAPRRRTPTRPQLEQLENRVVLSTWTALGPAPIDGGQVAGSTPVSGRITGIAPDPHSANTVYIAAAGGGVWKTTNATAASPTWTPLTDNLTNGSNPLPLFMGAIAETDDSHGNQIVYAGTGEANNGVDNFYGNGILVSKNGGSTWTLTNAGGALTGRTVARIAIDPSDTSGGTAYAAVSEFGTNGVFGNGGIWKTTNFGTTWTNTTGAVGLSTNDDWSDVAIDPHTPHTVYGAQGTSSGTSGNGVYKSTNGGTTWTLLSNGPNGATDGRFTLAVFDNGTTNKLLVSVDDPNTNGLLEMVLSTNGGSTFSQLTRVPNYLGSQGFYDTTLAIDPANANYFYAAGDMSNQGPTFSGSPIESTNGGQTWIDLGTDSAGNGPHSDSHAVAFDANGNVLEGNDGGIWRLNNPTNVNTQTWTDLNTNLEITQFTGIALDPTNAHVAYGGAQDNGTDKYTGTTTWNLVDFGDGGMVRVDPTNHNTVYHTFAGFSMQLSTDAGATWNDISSGIFFNTDLSGNPLVNFYAPFTLDSSGNVYYGSDFLNFSSDHGTTWSQIGSPGVNNFNSADVPIDAVAVSSKNNNVVYVSAGGNLFVTKNAQTSATWTQVNLPGGASINGLGDFGQDAIAVDPSVASGGTAYAVIPAFTGGGKHVFKTTNFGSTWTDISAHLLDTPCNAVAVSSDGTTVWVGTDVGVYSTSNGGASWARFGTGMPNVKVTDLEDVPGLHLLGAATHGRGAFEISDVTSPLGNLTISNPHATEDAGFHGFTLSTFTDSQSGVTAGAFTATVTWGDGTTSTLSGTAGSIVSLGGGKFALVASHTYADEGTKTVSVQVSDKSGDSLSGSTAVAVADAALSTLGLTNPHATEGKATGTFTVATFTDKNVAAATADFTAVVHWGDGTTSTVTSSGIVSLGGGKFAVRTSHTYAESGSFGLSVHVLDDGGASVSGSLTLSVADAALGSLSVKDPHASHGHSTGTFTVATFHDNNLGAPTADFTAIIHWGDGTTSTITNFNGISGSNGNYAVLASHLYASAGTFTVSVTVDDVGGASVAGTLKITVS